MPPLQHSVVQCLESELSLQLSYLAGALYFRHCDWRHYYEHYDYCRDQTGLVVNLHHNVC